jgi:acyl-CoA thioester hydrolase
MKPAAVLTKPRREPGADYHSYQARVYYEDTDAGGVMYHAGYVRFAERARTEFLRAHGFNQSDLIATDGVMFAVTHIDMHFLRPARLDDLIEVCTTFHQTSSSRLMAEQLLRNADTDFASAKVSLCCITLAGKPTRIPPAILAKLGLTTQNNQED